MGLAAHDRVLAMRAVVQRVSRASVTVGSRVTGRIATGLLVLLGVARDDTADDSEYLAEKIFHLRVFDDDEGKMNRSVGDVGGSVLVVSQFTLLGDVRRGRRPSYTEAAEPVRANDLYTVFVTRLRNLGTRVETGVFQAMMEVELVNTGPVTVLLDSRKAF